MCGRAFNHRGSARRPTDREHQVPLAKMTSVPVPEGETYPSDAFVGPYWFVRDESGTNVLIAHGCVLTKAERYGQFLTCPHGHYDLWDRWRAGSRGARTTAIVRAFEYEEWPRGRVVFDSVPRQFLVYADAQIFRRDLQERILQRFRIPPNIALFLRDEHYASTQKLVAE